MRRTSTALLAIATVLVVRPTGQSSRPAATPLWSVTEGMDSPESVFWDPRSGFVFVSQIGGQAAERDGNGRISKLTLDGKVVAADWVQGLNAPKGLRSSGGTLYAADIDQVVGVDIASGRITSRITIEGAQVLNDLATAPDGTIYTSDSFANRIYAIKNGKPSVFFEGDAVPMPNGVLANGPTGTPDGVEHDGRGGFIVSDAATGRILRVSPSGEVRLVRQLDRQTADICFIPARGLLLVPHLGLNRVSA